MYTMNGGASNPFSPSPTIVFNPPALATIGILPDAIASIFMVIFPVRLSRPLPTTQADQAFFVPHL